MENLPPVHHKAWEAERLRALNEVLSVELQPEELLLEAVEAPWKEVSDEESSDEEMMVASSLYTYVPRWASTKEDEGRGQRSGWPRQAAAEEREQAAGRSWREEARKWQVEHARVHCRSWWYNASCWKVHNEGSAVTSDTARPCWQGDLVGGRSAQGRS